MAINPAFANQARIFGKAFTDDLRKPEVQAYENSDWRYHKSKLQAQFGYFGIDVLRWAVGAIREQIPKSNIRQIFMDGNGNAHSHFDRVASEIMRNLPPYNAESGSDPVPNQHVGLFMVELKDNLLLPVLYPAKAGKRGQRGAHLTVVVSNPPDVK